MKTRIILGLCVATLAAASIVPAQAKEPPALVAIKDKAEHARVAKLIEGARKEGGLNWIGVYSEPQQARRILAAFKKEYGLPNLHAEYSYVGTGELISRVNQLLNAHRNNFDIVWTSSWAWYKDLLKAGQLMKYNSPYYKQFTLSNKAGMSEPGYWVSDAYAQAPLFNTKALADHHIKNFNGTSYAQFADPNLKGLIALPDPYTSVSTAQAFIGLVRVMGKDWLKKVAQNNPVLRAKSSQGRAWVASGEFPVTLGYAKDAVKLKASQVPIKYVYPKEGVVLLPFAPVIMHSAPDPDAAKLFIDYISSAKGAQDVMDSGSAMLFGRPGVKSPDPSILPAWEDIKVIPMNWNEDGSTAAIKKIRAIAKAAGLH